MLGLADFSIFLVFILCISSTIFCVIYGIFNWNKGEDTNIKIAKYEYSKSKSSLAKQEV